MRSAALFPVVKCVEVCACQIDRLTKAQNGPKSSPQNTWGYAFYAEQEYEREDGTKGNGFTITKAFDISQTRGQQPLPSQQRLPEEIIAAMVEQSPVPLAISDQLPQGVQAQYVPKQRTIYVRNGMDETATICAIAREQAHAGFDTERLYRHQKRRGIRKPSVYYQRYTL